MKKCHVCMAECEDNAEVCNLCGAFLTEEDAVNEEAEALQEEIYLKNPVLLATFDDVVNAEIFRDILKDNGIPCTGDTADNKSSLKVVFGVGLAADDIYVDENDFDEADRLYREFLDNLPEFGEFEDFEEE